MDTETQPDAALAVERLSYSFGDNFALQDVSFTIRPGQFTVLLGPNGAGKTTLFSLVTRLYDSRDGEIRIHGFDVRKRSLQALSKIGVVFQQPTLDLDLTVMQNLFYHASLHGIGRAEARARSEAELDRLDMLERRHEKVRRLNGGHRRRVEIARALLHQPPMLLLDEPTVGLDVPTRHGIVEHVHRLCRESDLAVLWATHLIDEVAEGDRVVLLHRGRIQAQGSLAEVNQAAGGADLTESFYRLTSGQRP